VQAPRDGDNWLSLTSDELAVHEAYAWAVRPECGAVVLFSGTVRDHAEGRHGVERLTYEAYEEQAIARFQRVAAETRKRWPTVGRLVIWHRTGTLALGESSVLVVVSSAHRAEAFEAARYAIDAVKAAAPIWKREEWEGGSGWGTGATSVTDPLHVTSAPGPESRSGA
jgi:molybdopterin synthase catalytic subunit